MPVAYHDLEKDISIGTSGVGMLALRDAARCHGVPAEVRRYPGVSSLEQCNLPAIAYLRGLASIPGHFVVVERIDENEVWFYDGTTGERRHIACERFRKYWTGHMLEPFPNRNRALLLQAGGSALFWIALAAWRAFRGPLTKWILVTLTVTCGGGACSRSTAPLASSARASAARNDIPEVASFWRTSGNDGANCLYLAFRVLGKRVEYEEITSQFVPDEPVSLGSLKAAAGALGLNLTAR